MTFVDAVQSNELVAGSAGFTTSAVVTAASIPHANDFVQLLLPVLSGVLSGVVALAFRVALTAWHARRSAKKALLLEEANKLRNDEDVSNDTAADAKEGEAKLIDAELKAIETVLDKK